MSILCGKKMEFEKAFGEGKVIDYRGFREVTDKIVPNHHLSRDSKVPLKSSNDYPTISKYISETFTPIEKEFSFSIFKPSLDIKYHSALLTNGITIALKGIKDGYSQYFLSNYFLMHLKQRNLCIVRFGGWRDDPTYFTIEIDTRNQEFNSTKLELKFETKTFYHEHKRVNLIESDIITNAEDLVGITKKGYTYVAKGTISKWEFLIDHLENNFSKGEIPFNLQTIRTSYYNEKDLIAGCRVHKENGTELFLTKEGYVYLKEQDFSILRAIRNEETNDWVELEILFHPMVIV